MQQNSSNRALLPGPMLFVRYRQTGGSSGWRCRRTWTPVSGELQGCCQHLQIPRTTRDAVRKILKLLQITRVSNMQSVLPQSSRQTLRDLPTAAVQHIGVCICYSVCNVQNIHLHTTRRSTGIQWSVNKHAYLTCTTSLSNRVYICRRTCCAHTHVCTHACTGQTSYIWFGRPKFT